MSRLVAGESSWTSRLRYLGRLVNAPFVLGGRHSGAARCPFLPTIELADQIRMRRHPCPGIHPELLPDRWVAQLGLGIASAARDEPGKLGAARRLAGRVIAQVHAPAHVLAVVRQGAVRRGATQEE